MTPTTRAETFFKTLAEIDPHPKGELYATNTFTLLLAVVLSAQATDAGVNKATQTLFDLISTPEDMVKMGEETLLSYIKTIGLYRTKGRHLIQLSQQLIDLHKGEVPQDRTSLEALPGVGRKTANVVLNIAFGEPTLAVDTHVFRVARRVGLSSGTTPLAVEKDLLRIIPKAYAQHAHHWLILHGRYLCKAQKPGCWRCPVAHICAFTPKEKEPRK